MAFSPHHEAGGTLHLPSPTQHSYRVDNFPSIRQLRRSLSRSPSKTTGFQLYNPASPSGSPESPLSPLAVSRALGPKNSKDSPPFAICPSSPLAPQTVPVPRKAKLTFRRAPPFRSSPRWEAPTKHHVRSVLSDISNQHGITPPKTRPGAGEENEEVSPSEAACGVTSDRKGHASKLELNDGPIKFEFARPPRPKLENAIPAKSSPLKRSDGTMSLEHASWGSPMAKRRSLHGAFLGTEFDIFEQGSNNARDSENRNEVEKKSTAAVSSSHGRRPSPLRKSLSLRKSTLQQRYAGVPSRPRGHHDQVADFTSSATASARSRHRTSLDSAWFSGSESSLSSQKRLQLTETPSFLTQPNQRTAAPQFQQNHQPHPLSHALTPSSSTPKEADDSQPMQPHDTSLERIKMPLSKSLPVGATRPIAPTRSNGQDAENSFATPDGYRSAKPLPAAFMSTGLISKRNRNIDETLDSSLASYAMPDTPSKRSSFPPLKASPCRPNFSKTIRSRPEFGTPTTPFGPHTTRPSVTKGVSIFGTRLGNSKSSKKISFSSISGDDASQSLSDQIDSQSSNDELPPTPTKTAGADTKIRSKGNSLRSSLFGRRVSLGFETFLPPPDIDTGAGQTESPKPKKGSQQSSPHTPQESFTPPDPSSLSISGDSSWRSSTQLGRTSTGTFPPATPTASREQGFHFVGGNGGVSLAGVAVNGVTNNDVDTTVTSRFAIVQSTGVGEFSQVFRVEAPIAEAAEPSTSTMSTIRTSVGKVWAIKKARRAYVGPKDRERKLQEANILKSLRGHDHVISYVDSWESKGHLYIQTEFCENGDLKTFLTQTGYKGRLDDFRIWKILLELSMGVKHIHDLSFVHLDLKPANIFIDWEGVLKIGDFGLASVWPTPSDIDGEGDREYIGPEVLSGRFDKPGDVFSLGMIMLEIAGNIILPDNGTSWQRLRAGDLSDLPGLTYSSDNSLERDQSGDPVGSYSGRISMTAGLFSSDDDPNDQNEMEKLGVGLKADDLYHVQRRHGMIERVTPPNFMVDPDDAEALDQIVQWMISPDPEHRPAIDAILQAGGVQWVGQRRRAGATVYEGNWGPADEDVLGWEAVPTATTTEAVESTEQKGGGLKCLKEEEKGRDVDIDMMDIC